MSVVLFVMAPPHIYGRVSGCLLPNSNGILKRVFDVIKGYKLDKNKKMNIVI